MTLALIIFLVTYVLLLALPKYRAYIALASAAVFVMLGILPVENVFGSVDWNVIMMIAGTMGIVYFFIESKMPALLADIIIQKMPNVKWTIIALSLFAGIISAFVDNVATVLMVAPVALTISKKLNMSPVSSIIAISISSNLQGAATLVGDTTSILLGGYANLDFLDFFFYKGRPGMFWVVEISAVIASLVLLVVFRKDKQTISLKDRTAVTDYFPTVILLGTIILLILASFLPDKPQITNGLICMALFVFSLIRDLIVKRNFGVVKEALKSIDYFTLCLLAGLFIVIAGITEAGVVDAIAKLFCTVCGGSLIAMYSWARHPSGLLTIPYTATICPLLT